MKEQFITRNSIPTRSYLEFPFAPGIVTLCAASGEDLVRILGTRSVATVKTTMKDFSFAVYLPVETWMTLEKVSSSIEVCNPGTVSAVFPKRWMICRVGAQGLRGITTSNWHEVQNHLDSAECNGEFLLAMPVPGSRSVIA